MALSSVITHQTEPYLNLQHNDNQNLSIHHQTLTLSKLFGCSIHNCLCRRFKTALILYPKDIQIKNVILLVCEQCHNYKSENNSISHTQLEKWCFNIYKDSKSFHFKSRFLQNEDGSLYFHSAIFNINDSFNIEERELENWEKEIIQQIIQKKLDNVRAEK